MCPQGKEELQRLGPACSSSTGGQDTEGEEGMKKCLKLCLPSPTGRRKEFAFRFNGLTLRGG